MGEGANTKHRAANPQPSTAIHTRYNHIAVTTAESRAQQGFQRCITPWINTAVSNGGKKWETVFLCGEPLKARHPKVSYLLTGFLGEYEVAIDAKGRFLLPAGFRKQLPEGASAQFVINRGFEQCLTVYPMESWSRISERLAKLNDFNPKVREFKRLFLNGATIVELDSAGRINLPKALVAHAGLSKDAVFTAQGDKMELWDADTYRGYLEASKAGFSDLAAEVAGGDFFDPFNSGLVG